MKIKKWMMVVVVALALTILISVYFIIQKEKEETRLIESSLYHWVTSEHQNYLALSEQLEAVLASGAASDTLNYLNDVEEKAGTGISGTDILRLSGVNGVYLSGIRPYEPYRYVEYLVETWDGNPLTNTEWSLIKATYERSKMGASSFSDIKDLLSRSEDGIPSERIQKKLKELEKEWDTLITPSEKDEAFHKFKQIKKYGTTGKVMNPLADLSKLSQAKVKAKAEEFGREWLGSKVTLRLDQVGDGHLDKEFGEALMFTTEKNDLRLNIATHGGRPLRLASQNPEKQTLDIDELVGKVMDWAESISVEGMKFKSAIGRSGEEYTVIDVFEVVNGVNDRAHAIRIYFHYNGSEENFEKVTFVDFYKDRTRTDLKPDVSVKEARNAISTELMIDGEPELALVKGENKGETLLAYLFKIEGIDARIVTVNAETGEFVRVE